MQISINHKIIGLLLIIFLLLGQAPLANAIYSRHLNSVVAPVKNHIREARRQNGVGTLRNAWDKVNAENKAAKERGEAYGTPGLYASYLSYIKNMLIESLNSKEKGISFINSFKLYFVPMIAPFVSNTACWRDDVWELQALQEEVTNELLKSGLLGDRINGNLLRDDYKVLNRLIADLVKNHKDAKWFGSGNQNYYINCPFGEFDQAFKELGRSWEHLLAVFSGETTGDWGSLREMAQKNAKRKAANWIKANKISFTLGGEAGANPRSLVNGMGIQGLIADAITGAKYWEAYGQMIYNNTYWAIAGRGSTDFETIIQAYDAADKAGEQAKTQMKNEIEFNLQFNNINEQALIVAEDTLFRINEKIKQITKEGVMKVCEQLYTLLSNTNKSKNNGLTKCTE